MNSEFAARTLEDEEPVLCMVWDFKLVGAIGLLGYRFLVFRIERRETFLCRPMRRTIVNGLSTKFIIAQVVHKTQGDLAINSINIPPLIL